MAGVTVSAAVKSRRDAQQETGATELAQQLARARQRRVAFVLPSFAAGGAQKVLLMLAARLDRAAFAPIFIVFSKSGPWRDRLPRGFPVISLDHPNLRAALPALWRTLRAERPDVIVSTLAYVNIGLCMIAPLLGYRPRIVVREANTPRQHARGLFGRLGYRLAYRLLYRRADRVICPARYLADELANEYGVKRESIVVLANPLDEDALRADAAPPRRSPGTGRRFVAVGRLAEQKGYDRLLDDFARLPEDSHLIIFGEGEQRNALERQMERLGLRRRVALVGFEPNPAPWLAGADALLMPSRWEGLPNVALEALACGTPVIAMPEAGGIAEIAALAPPAAVTIIAAGPAFTSAMLAIAARRETALRPSLLPDAYRLAPVAEKFVALLAA